MQTQTEKLNAILNSMEAGAILELTEEQISLLQNEHPTWIPARGEDGKLRVTNLISKPEGK